MDSVIYKPSGGENICESITFGVECNYYYLATSYRMFAVTIHYALDQFDE